MPKRTEVATAKDARACLAEIQYQVAWARGQLALARAAALAAGDYETAYGCSKLGRECDCFCARFHPHEEEASVLTTDERSWLDKIMGVGK